MDWTALDYEKIANAVVILIVGLAAGLGLRKGRNSAAPSGATMEVAGALIDSASARQLAAAIEAQTMEMINCRKSGERGVEALAESLDDLTQEIEALKMEVVRKH